MTHVQGRGIQVLTVVGLAVLVLGAGCTDRATDEKVEKLFTAMDRFAVPSPAEYPPGIPTFPGLRGVMIMGTSSVGNLSASSKAPVKKLVRHYKKAFENGGWVFDKGESDTGEGLYCYRAASGSGRAAFLISRFDKLPVSNLTITVMGQ